MYIHTIAFPIQTLTQDTCHGIWYSTAGAFVNVCYNRRMHWNGHTIVAADCWRCIRFR